MVETITEACVGREREELAAIVSGMKRLLESKLEQVRVDGGKPGA